jgi:hypothetical protein
VISSETLDKSFYRVQLFYLIENNFYNLVGWGGSLLSPQVEEVQVLGPQSCNVNLNQTFCSNFDTNDMYAPL